MTTKRLYVDPEDFKEEFDDYLNETYDYVEIAGIEYAPSQILEAVDPVAYEEAFKVWLDKRCAYDYEMAAYYLEQD